MKLLIAIKSCHEHHIRGFHDAIIHTWGHEVPKDVDLRFFVGSAGRFDLFDNREIGLGVEDDYLSLPLKTKAILGWSLYKEYDFTFLCDTDTYLIPELLVKSGYEHYDYSGRFGTAHPIGNTFFYRDPKQTVENCYPWASGGVGYFVSRKAAELIVCEWPNHWAEDLWVGQILGKHHEKGRITIADLPIECDSAWHFPRREYKNEPYSLKFGWMEKMYREHGRYDNC